MNNLDRGSTLFQSFVYILYWQSDKSQSIFIWLISFPKIENHHFRSRFVDFQNAESIVHVQHAQEVLSIWYSEYAIQIGQDFLDILCVRLT